MRSLCLIFWAFATVAMASANAVAPHGISGHASFYGEEYRGRITASGAPFDPDAMTAASWDFPLGSRVRVTHGERAIVVTITDRGPSRRLREQGRVLDLSEAAFARLAPVSVGVIGVSVALDDKSPATPFWARARRGIKD